MNLGLNPDIGVLHFNTFLVPGFLLQQLIPKKSILFFWCVFQTRVSVLKEGRLFGLYANSSLNSLIPKSLNCVL